MKKFNSNNQEYMLQFSNKEWITENENFEEDLKKKIQDIAACDKFSKMMKKAKVFELLASESPIAIDKEDIFQDKLYVGKLMHHFLRDWKNDVVEQNLSKEFAFKKMCDDCGIFGADADFGHTSPNSELLLKVGIRGVIERLEVYSNRENLTESQKEFYKTCKISLKAMEFAIERFANAIRLYNEENYKALKNISCGAPSNTYEALQLLVVYFFLHEYVYATRLRTLGRVDVLLQPFYERDIQNGVFTKAEIKEMLKFFLNKFWLAKVAFDLPFALGGMGVDGEDVTNEMSYLIVETYNELNIYSPKIHIKVCEKTPKDFIKLVMSYIRGGNSSFVFVNDHTAIKSLVDVGIEEKDARNYVPIGCYEPAVWGVEIGCTGNAGLNLAKSVELVMTRGYDNASNTFLGVEVGEIKTYEDFVSEIKKQIKYYNDCTLKYVCDIEKLYGELNFDAFLSATYDHCVESGIDAFAGGAKYNNSSIAYQCIATLVDSISAVKKIVFDEKLVSYDEFCEILKNNWKGHEDLRTYALRECPKYGNNDADADAIARDISDYVASISNNRPNSRGGVFKASCFSIDLCFPLGKKTMATPDGRYAGEPLSKNMCATVGMDKEGVTALINSVGKMDMTKFSNGSVLDIVLHPTVCSGEDGLEVFYSILKTYFAKGGFAMHFNVFDSKVLKDAQKYPEKYSNLQVRLCGWNVYFVNLTKDEQDSFIRQAENTH